MDYEKSLLMRLKSEMGVSFTSKMERMFQASHRESRVVVRCGVQVVPLGVFSLQFLTCAVCVSWLTFVLQDVSLSAELETDFNTWQKHVETDKRTKQLNDSRIELSPTVVSNGCWPSSVIYRTSDATSSGGNLFPLECILPVQVEETW